MFSILIVDDEAEIREGLASLDWHSIGYEVAGVGTHGLDALVFLEEKPVDVILTDIRMPFMDGIQLLEAAKKKYPFIKVIILSGYNDFDYAKKALRLGAVDYLLKPTNVDELFIMFRELHAAMTVEMQSEFRKASLERKERLLSRILRTQFLKDVLRGTVNSDDIEQAATEAEVLISKDSVYQVSILLLDRFRKGASGVSMKELRLITFSLDNMLLDLWEANGYGYHYVDLETAACYFIGKDIDMFSHMQRIKKQLTTCMGLWQSTFTAGIGVPVTNFIELHLSLLSAEQGLNSSKDGNRVIVGTDIGLNYRIVAPISPPLESLESKGAHYLIEEAKKYIDQNFTMNTTTLKKVAENVHVTPNYLSSLFKESGESFIQYITSLRMDKAKQLLRNPQNKIYEIVEMVGYSDPAYFSELFKKNVGKTPMEYRISMEA